MSDVWRRCSVCKDEIGLGETYFICSVTTCNKVGRESVFCSAGCWDAHVPVMNHKDAGYLEKIAPSSVAQEAQVRVSSQPNQNKVVSKSIKQEMRVVENQSSSDKDILVVVSKMKDYIQKTAGLNTSGTVAAVISDRVRALCDEAVKNATTDGRKTVMDRDFRVESL